jgi:non-canonical purine NTP pyrophosphatase (RdgB/HAM1 family)
VKNEEFAAAMMKIVFATNNEHKLSEIRSILGPSFEVVSLADIGCHEDIPETGKTLEENALMKAQYVYDHYHISCFADDTGLEVEALDGAPGVYSARYAAMEYTPTLPSSTTVPAGSPSGLSHNSEANMARLLRELANCNNRKARFRTVIALIEKKDVCPCGCTSIQVVHQFEGIVNGEIIQERRGGEGFGYDPIFQPEGYDKTFAELGADIKNTISHRARATAKLAKYLGTLLFCLFSFLPLNAQIGTWRNFLAYQDVQQIQATGNYLFVLASNGLYQYNKTDQSILTYDKTNGLNDTYITHIRWCQQAKRLVIIYGNANIDLMDTDGNVTNLSDLYLKAITGDKTIHSVTINGQYAYLACGFGIVKVNVKDAEISESYMLGFSVDAIAFEGGNIYARSQDGTVWTGSTGSNLIDKSNWQQALSYPTFVVDNSDYEANIALVSTLQPGGPKYNYFYESKFLNGKLYTTGGGFLAGQVGLGYPGIVQIMDGNNWTLYPTNIDETTGWPYQDISCIDVDPTDPNHVAVAGRCGLYEFQNGQLKTYHYKDNSPLQPVEDLPNDYTIVIGMKYDNQGNLWVLNSLTKGINILKLTNSGQWEKHTQDNLFYSDNVSLPGMRCAMFDSRGLLWFVNSNHNKYSIVCYDPNSDQSFLYDNFTNQDGKSYEKCYPYDITEDLNGNMWVATACGPFIIKKEDVGQSTVTLYQEKVPRNDGTNYADYLLSDMPTNSIAIDGAGQKWIATRGTGVFLISQDNMQQVQHFTADNSCLLSDYVNYVSINQQTGEVFFLTDKGLCSYVSNATEAASDMSEDNVWAYPNPVTPDYTGLISITGLTLNADVKILAADGAIVHEGRSNGGTYTWDGCDKKGRRVTSGVYMVATAKSDGSKGTVCKIAVIR